MGSCVTDHREPNDVGAVLYRSFFVEPRLMTSIKAKVKNYLIDSITTFELE